MSTSNWKHILALVCTFACQPGVIANDIVGEPWIRHTIDDSSRGADGVRVDDINGDGAPDFVTGWEEGGIVRVYLNPGPESARDRWPAVTVGRVASPEDAVFADVDRDGILDVVSCCEGRTRTMFVHWAPGQIESLLDEDAWETEEIPVTSAAQSWMFCLPLATGGAGNIELFAGAKGGGAQIVRLLTSDQPRELRAWRADALYDAGWIMSLIAGDMDGDGDDDLLFSDRKGPTRGCKWLENTGPDAASEWPVHLVGGGDHEVMFLARGDVDHDGLRDVVAATRDAGILVFHRNSPGGDDWTTETIPMPSNTGTGKGVAVSDLDGDGRQDLIVSCENATGRTGLFSLHRRDTPAGNDWSPRDISGSEWGIKFDRLELIDLDADGDEDVITCEERDNLGLIWYENPSR
jgi:hypothetical protein